jgi:hypothetical protein
MVHDRFGSRSDLNINGHLHYPNDIDGSLTEDVTDKIRKYRVDYNNNPPTTVTFMTPIGTMSGRLHTDPCCPHSSRKKLVCFSIRIHLYVLLLI